ncbi:DUF6580 family putative transport protein [Fimbriiglobus ruber]|uniref:Uncharacterized protein n=1 Tax=Fimbriiglobus ruber TaxID=1908690 RepID=A0A225DII7_9BACT|nr:DUF6580 family putative transport protein [Fimbriiglobus ruber]OWK41262.1 hypothetical protein FRUB_04625 [Fimbriiglobus ruber]
MNVNRFLVVAIMIVSAALTVMLPHPPNFTPIGAMALFGGVCVVDRRAAVLLPLAPLFLHDLWAGLHVLIPFVYVSFAINVLLGRWLRSRRRPVPVAVATLAGSLQFFVVTNFGSWLAFYPHTPEGLIANYVAGIPFFQYTLLGDATYSVMLFGGLAIAETLFPTLRERVVPTTA